ncbi:hypothetical protein QN277_027395 [Acacia crassicarpa]|uniref:MSP domain-containing protein n=1 Tax=Acacia crassicarpa TaxID=499986 RepID=A0AAE1MLX3_9FABA|nr:hypothetical protein QN277_027395 [Acacia crassicarpa]
MATELLDIEPHELKFVFELKKQSSCLVQLANKSDHYVAFKVKTTSPKKYCVRPNIGIVKPNSRSDFTVTMQAQRLMPPDMQCKDKFLIQSVVVPSGTTEDDITSETFAKVDGKLIEEKKLRVALTSPPSSPVLLPVNGEAKQDPPSEIHLQRDRVSPSGAENIPPPTDAGDVKGFETAQDMEQDRAIKSNVSRPAETVDGIKVKDAMQFNLAKDSEELKSRLNLMDSKLREAELVIKKLDEERRLSTQEKDMLKHELEVLKKGINAKRVQAGFPLLFVCMVALISVVVGYYIHP